MMSKSRKIKVIALLILLMLFVLILPHFIKHKAVVGEIVIKLPIPSYQSHVSIEAAIIKRRSVRKYTNEPLTVQEISQLLWAAQGITSVDGLRAAPSAGALYPLKIYLISENVKGLVPGVYLYIPESNSLKVIAEGGKYNMLKDATLGQDAVQDAKAVIVIAAKYKITVAKYGERGKRYVYMEAGHVAENIYLQAVSLGVGTVSLGAFDDAAVRKIIDVLRDVDPLYIMPVGKRAE